MELQERTRIKNSIDQLQARGDLFTRQLIQEKQRIANLQSQFKQVNDKIANLRNANKAMAMELLNKFTTTPNDAYHRVDGINPARLAEANQKKIVKNLESRLGKALIRRNQIENENAQIKQKIDTLRRKIISDIKSKESMEKELMTIQADMDNILKRAAVASDEREKLMDQRNQILAENKLRQAAFEKEYDELTAVIAKHSKSLDESIANVADNVVSMLSAAAGSDSLTPPTSAIDSVDDTRQLEEKLAALEKQYADTQRVLHDNESKIQTYEEKFKELRDVSGLSSTDDIIHTFVKNEKECFAIFDYIQAVSQDCDKTMERSSRLRAEIDKYRQEEMENERSRLDTVNVYKTNLQGVKSTREKIYQTTIECRRTIETIAKRVTALYFKLKCNEIDREEIVQKNTLPANLRSDRKLTTVSGGEVSEQNILNLMEMIETRSIQIINTYLQSLTSSKRLMRRPSLFLSPKTFERAIANSTNLRLRTDQVNLNEQSDESDEDVGSSFTSSDDDDDGRPMSVHDMRRQAAEFIKSPESSVTAESLNHESSKQSIILPRHTVV
ncbi:hypothetical protein HJC23_001851 [Cyclotella cryptica]|uniref:ODAD1 central coiled coil region domain-containing protein n=1 Tax=Cyclotella cryptica TaxID=29204 RepID=A0ABD3PZ29_9STRA|eukprot:CCRYP_009896-RA/>CCRYP_009896-RA protein AED:0.10 eAED:0.08 QI:0/0/0/0.5/1/1/2/0/557